MPDSPGIDARCSRSVELTSRRDPAAVRCKIGACNWRSRNSTRCVGDLPANARRILDAAAQGRARRRDAGRHARTVAVRLSARRPGAAPGVPRCLRERTRGAGGAGDRGRAAGRLSGAARRPAPQRDGGHPRWPRRAGLSQAVPAQLHGVRRRALFHARQRAVRVRRRRRALRARHLRRHLVSRARRARAGGRRAGAAGRQRLAVPHAAAGAAPRAGRSRAPARPACPSSTSIASAARTSSCSTARRSCSTRTARWRSSFPAWHETVAIVDFDGARPRHVRGALDPRLEPHVYDALVMGVRDYVRKNRFPGVLLGLSGGVDSALTLAVAVDALGRDHVRAVMLPSPYNAPISLDDAREMAGILGVRYDEIPIEPVFSAFLDDAGAGIPRPAARRHRGEHPGAHSRHAADGAVQQVRLDRADHRQQVGNGGRLRDAVRRHGRRLRGAEGHSQDAGLPAVPTTATAWDG